MLALVLVSNIDLNESRNGFERDAIKIPKTKLIFLWYHRSFNSKKELISYFADTTMQSSNYQRFFIVGG
jgi:hypothetical protein